MSSPKLNTDRPVKRSQRSPQPNSTTKRNIPVPEYIRQLQRLQPLSGMTCYEAEFVRTAIAHPDHLTEGEINTVAAIHDKHLGKSGKRKQRTPEPTQLSWHDELEAFESDWGAVKV
jgi:hypothetical protein